MEGLKAIQQSLDLIEELLPGKIKSEDIAAAAGLSSFHYQRMFQILTGFTLQEYIRNRRLTLAAQELQASSRSITELSWDYGYETPESFSKAFKTLHGIPPSSVRVQSHPLKAYPKLSFHLQLKGAVELDYKVVKREKQLVSGKKVVTSLQNGQHHRDIAAFWREAHDEGWIDTFDHLAGELGVLGICMHTEGDQLTYMIAVEGEHQPDSSWTVAEIPPHQWAVFPVRGAMPHAMPPVWERIFAEWFPATGYEHAGGPELEVYSTEGDPYQEDYESEIWIPVT
ncbi:AraC family transcriptional regulator [Alkalicoccus luteus]|uniref:AraC family transcriptional regulator n=1 Tax=Alkalicoccus luteus TaxID=1237094 RepID=UPI004033C854